MSELAVDKDETRRPFEHVLDHRATLGVGIAEIHIDGGHTAPASDTRRECLEGVAARKDGHLEHVVAHRAIGGSAIVKRMVFSPRQVFT